jgi:hypothetical protein
MRPAMTMAEDDRRRGVRRTALWLALVALAVYLGFIAMGVFKGL